MIKYASRKDPLTGEVFIPKRKNQKFSNKSNQIKFNNKKYSFRKKVVPANKILSKSIFEDTSIIPKYYNVIPVTESKAGRFVTLVICCGLIITSIYFIYRKK